MADCTTAHASRATRLRLPMLIKLPPAEGIGFILRAIFLCLCTVFGFLTARILLWDVHRLDDLTIDHYGAVGSLFGAVVSSIFCGLVIRYGKLLAAFGLAITWLVTTGICLSGSVGRADDMAFERNAVARQVNRDRERAQRNRDEAQKRYDTALEAETDECSRGAGPRCLGRRATTHERRSDMEVAELLLQKAKPEQRENGKLKRLAQVLSMVSRLTEEEAERRLVILWPFLPPLSYELLTIIFGHLGFAPWKRRAVAPTVPSVSATVQAIERPHDTVQETVDAEWTPVSVEHARQLARNVEAEGVFNALRSVQPKAVSNDELAAMLSVSKAESSRRVSDLVRVGMVRRQPAGRYVAISLRPMH